MIKGREEWEEAKRERKRAGQDQVCLCECSISHPLAFRQDNWKNSGKKKKIYFLNMYNYGEKAMTCQNVEKKQPLNSGSKDYETPKIYQTVRTTTYICNVLQGKNVTVHKNSFFHPSGLVVGGLTWEPDCCGSLNSVNIHSEHGNKIKMAFIRLSLCPRNMYSLLFTSKSF